MRALAAIALVCGLLAPGMARGATVRGRVLRKGNPAPFATVVLVGASGRSAPATTGSNGLYYFTSVPAGCYTLQVWLGSAKDPALSVPGSCVTEPLTDLPPIRLDEAK